MLAEVLIVSAMPISEIRGGIPLAIYYGLNPISAYLVAFVGNLIPIPLLLLSLDKLMKLMMRIDMFKGFYSRLIERVEKKRDLIEKYGYIGLTLFVAIPLPITGAWTATLLAIVLNLKKVKSLLFISVGIGIAGLIVLTTTIGVLNLLKSFQLPLQ